jgi:dolichyl-phosphate beta-glucosyltransferase
MEIKKISIMVPAYNEEDRLPDFLNSLCNYCVNNKIFRWEVIVINDGSYDGTSRIIEKISKKFNFLIGLSHNENMGKGAAIKTGVKNASGDIIIFIDADGSISPEEIDKMINVLEWADVGIGYRIHRESKIIVKQPLKRIFAGKIFNLIVNLILDLKIYDTLCGFKGLNAEYKNIILDCQTKRWSFDVEMLYLAKKDHLKIEKIPIIWKHTEGSKISLLRDPIEMIKELIKIRTRR